jgi:hypothetical protein
MPLLNLFINSNDSVQTIKNYFPRRAKNLTLITQTCNTDSTTNKIYYVEISNLVNTIVMSNVNYKQMIPVSVGLCSSHVKIADIVDIPPEFHIRVCDESGNLTTDTILINLLFSFE